MNFIEINDDNNAGLQSDKQLVKDAKTMLSSLIVWLDSSHVCWREI